MELNFATLTAWNLKYFGSEPFFPRRIVKHSAFFRILGSRFVSVRHGASLPDKVMIALREESPFLNGEMTSPTAVWPADCNVLAAIAVMPCPRPAT